MKRVCVCCGTLFDPRNKLQKYCLKIDCQRKRKSKWQKNKLSSDADYRESQADAQKLWREKNSGYMREYRSRHPAYVKRNREQQRQRRAAPKEPLLPPQANVVKMDASSTQIPLISGVYTLLPVGVVKMDAITVQLSVL